MSWSAAAPRAAVTTLLVLVLAGCSSTEDDRALQAADDFYTAVGADDAASACALLAPTTRDELEQSEKKPCDQSILHEDVPSVSVAERVKVYDTMVQVSYAADTVFLTRIADHWRVLAVGCTRRPGDLPYDCQVKGG